MCAVSDEERSRVAANLSGEAQAWRDTFPDEVCDLGDVPSLMQDLCHFAGLSGKVSCGDIFQRFADLIDRPTCRKVIPNEMEGYVFCSKCGAEIGEYSVPNYCPNCGAEVVDDE